MYNSPINPSDLPYHRHFGLNTPLPSDEQTPQTEGGQHVAHIAERLRVNSAVEPSDIELISLALAAHPDALGGQALLWVDRWGDALMAFEPNTLLLWHQDPQLLSNSGRTTAVVRFNDGQYAAMVDGEFILIDGDEIIYKTILTAVHQYGAGIVTDSEGKKLRMSLASLMQANAERLGQLWLNKKYTHPIDKAVEQPDSDHHLSLYNLTPPANPGLPGRGEFIFVPRLSDRGKVVTSLACLLNLSLSSAAEAGKNAQHPLMTTTMAANVANFPSGNHDVRTTLTVCDLATPVVAGKALLSWQKCNGTAGNIRFEVPNTRPVLASMPTDNKIQYRRPRHIPMTQAPTAAPQQVHVENNDVHVEQIDFSCLEQRQHLSFSDILRKIGLTLQNPITEFMREVQVIDYYERLGRCPSEEKINELTTITTGIDSFISFFMSVLPGSSSFVFLQNIGAPLFQLLSDAIESKDLDIDNVNAVNEQVLFLARTTWQFSPRDRQGRVINDKVTLPQNTFFKKNRLSTEINSDEFHLLRNNDHYIGWRNPIFRPIEYSPEEGKWLFLNNEDYWYALSYHEEMVDNYKTTDQYINEMGKYHKDANDIALDKKNIISILKKDGNRAKFVFMMRDYNWFLVESDFFEINGFEYGHARKRGMGNRIIRKNNSEFVFEAKSSKIHKNLIAFFDKIPNRKKISDDFHISSMMKDGFSYHNDSKYLKYNNEYYKISSDEYQCDYLSYREHGKYHRAYIKKNEAGFFTVDDGILHGKSKLSLIKSDEGIYIERKTESEIHNYCLPYVGNAKHLIDNGIFKNDNNQFIFSLNRKKYIISEYKRDMIKLKSKYPTIDDIQLYLTNDYAFEVKKNDGKTITDAIEMRPSRCIVRRSPTQGTCRTVSISQVADRLLRSKIKQGTVKFGVDEAHLHLLDLFPGLFLNTKNKKLYFKYDGHFYRASFSQHAELNVLKQKILHIYYKGLLGKRHYIASLVLDVVDDKLFIQTQEEKLSDSAGMTAREAVRFIREHKFFKITDFENLHDIVADINKKESLKFIDIQIKNFNIDIFKAAKESFAYDDDNFRIVSVNKVIDSDPLYLRGGALLVKGAIKQATAQIETAINELNNFTPNVRKYISYILESENIHYIHDFSKQLLTKLVKMKSKIQENNIKMVAKNREPITSDFSERDSVRDTDTLLDSPKHEDYFHAAAFDEQQRKSGAVAFVPANAEKNIYICLDKFYFIDPIHPDETLRETHVLDITETLIHEAVHSIGIPFDIIYVATEAGKLDPVLDAIDEFKEKMITDDILDNEALSEIQKNHMKLHPEYSKFATKPNDAGPILHYMFSHDTGFKANVLLQTPDFIAIFVRDLQANAAVTLSRR